MLSFSLSLFAWKARPRFCSNFRNRLPMPPPFLIMSNGTGIPTGHAPPTSCSHFIVQQNDSAEGCQLCLPTMLFSLEQIAHGCFTMSLRFFLYSHVDMLFQHGHVFLYAELFGLYLPCSFNTYPLPNLTAAITRSLAAAQSSHRRH